MQQINAPDKIVLPFANAGAKNAIPVPSQIGITAGAASLTDGFPPLTRTPKSAGGVPVDGLDMNGVLYLISNINRWGAAGAGYYFDSTFANDTNVGGYPAGARVLRTDATGYWLNTTDNNVTDPESAGGAAAGWVPDFTSGVAAVTMTSANVTLSELEYGKPIIVISGTLTASLNLIFPNIAGKWIVINNTLGAYTVTCKTAAGTGVVVSSALWLAGDGTNIYAAQDAAGVLSLNVSSAGGTADALTATLTPAPRSWSAIAGVPFFVRAASANATTTPTITANSGTLTAKTIVKGNGLALVPGDIAGAGHWLIMQYDTTLDAVVLANPATGISISGQTQIRTVSASVASNALTVGLSPTSLDFRSSTLASGAINTCVLGVPASLVVPSGATLGTVSGLAARLVLLAIDNAGTVELAVVNLAGGNNLDETTLISTTAISAAATSASVIYSTTARSNVPFRVVGFVDITESAAGTWATGPTVVQGTGGQALTALSSFGYGQTVQDLQLSRALATTYYNTTGKPIFVSVSGIASAAGILLYGYVDGKTTCQGTASYAASTGIAMVMPVPAGMSYSVVLNGGSISNMTWTEQR